ncbi:MAG TPA: ribosome-associated translation inhibitor RaiA [Thermoanaerobaculia bacterium]|nr:ribosome-associated translation inhibitor RaiA [Thermoanaerobaculia bacterium]
MATEISGRNYEVSDRIRDLITRKLSKVEQRLFDDVIDVRVVLDVQKYRNICEIIIVGKEHDVKSVQESVESMEDAINAALDHVKRQAQKNRKKIRDHHRNGRVKSAGAAISQWAVQVLEPGHFRETADQTRRRIIKTSNLPIRPMSIEHAALLLDDSKNEFIVFRDLDTDKVSVIYKRKDNNLGLIAPEF